MIVGPHSLGVVASQRAALSYKDLALSYGPVAHWGLDETTGTTAVDETGNGNDGQVEGSPQLEQDPLINNGNAVSFDGSDDRIDVGSAFDLDGSSAFSLLAWIKTTARSVGDNTGNYIMGTDLGTGVYMRVDEDVGTGGTLLVKMDDGTNDAFGPGATVIDDGIRHLCVLAFNGSRLKGFVDGVEEIDIDASAVGTMDTHLYVGGTLLASNDEFRYYSGFLDEVDVFDFALTETEVTDLYNKGVGQG